MGQESKHFDNHSSSYQYPNKQAHSAKNSRTVNTHALMAVKIHQKSPKIMKSLPSIQNMLNYTFASIGSKTEGKWYGVHLLDAYRSGFHYAGRPPPTHALARPLPPTEHAPGFTAMLGAHPTTSTQQPSSQQPNTEKNINSK